MPRELIHWHVVDRVLRERNLPEQVSRILERNLPIAMLGSFAHDVPYYFKAGHDDFEQIADYLHGKDGEDTFVPMKGIAGAILALSPERREPAWALLLGMLSHMAVDAVFHPMIFYFTGNYHDPDPAERPRAQSRHRLIEVYIDAWIEPQIRFPHGTGISTLLRSIGDRQVQQLADLLDSVLLPELFSGNGAPQKRWLSGFKQLGLYQRLFTSSTVGALIRGVSATGKLRGIDALFSFGRNRNRRFFDQVLCFQNPIDGSAHEATGQQLIDESVSLTREFMELLEPLVSGRETDAEAIFRGRIGPSLNFGLPGARADSAKHFSKQGLPLKGLNRLPNS